MALLKFVQKTGSVGASTFQRSSKGTLERARVMPINPQTTAQMNARQRLSAVASGWRGLTDEARVGWKALANQLGKGQSGFQVYTEVNTNLRNAGLPRLEDAPQPPAFGELTCTGLVVEDDGTLKLTQVSDDVAPDKFILYATAPLGAGRKPTKADFRFLQAVDGHAAPAADIDLAAAYTQRFGAPKAGQRVAVRLAPMKNGLKGLPMAFETLCVAADA